MIDSSPGLPRMVAFLFELAWASRVRLPLLIAAAFMLTNVHMRLEININFAMEEQIMPHEELIENESEGDENEDSEEGLRGQLFSQLEVEFEGYNDDEEEDYNNDSNNAYNDNVDESRDDVLLTSEEIEPCKNETCSTNKSCTSKPEFKEYDTTSSKTNSSCFSSTSTKDVESQFDFNS